MGPSLPPLIVIHLTSLGPLITEISVKTEFGSRSYQSKQFLPNVYAVGYMELSKMERWLLCSSLIHSATSFFLTYFLQTNRNKNLPFSPTRSLHLILSCSHLHTSLPAPHLTQKKPGHRKKNNVIYTERERGGGKEIKNYETVQSLYFTTPVKSFVEFHVGRRTFSLSKWFIVIYTNHQRACKPKAN